MKFFMILATLLCSVNSIALPQVSKTELQSCSNSEINVLKKLFDNKMIHVESSLDACTPYGGSCTESDQCCGSSFCHSGYCSVPSGECVAPGTRCEFTMDCCGSSTCDNNYCTKTADSCHAPGESCSESDDCCGSSFCHSGVCSDPNR